MSETGNIEDRIRELTGWQSAGRVEIITDTTDWMNIRRGNVIRLDGRDFLVKGNEYEKRFGIGDQPKYWVFGVLDLETGHRKIIKTVFHEDFHVHIGIFKIHCYRSPEKEARVLELVRGDDRFMQGYTVLDEKKNHVRIIDFIPGKTIFQHIFEIEKSHEEYFYEDLPEILQRLTDCIEAIRFLHAGGLLHGDIRNDHIIIESGTGRYRWIDFDLNLHVSDFDLWSLGNIINYAVGKGITTFKSVLKSDWVSAKVKESLHSEDASGFYPYRIMNLKKLYPYIPDGLSRILLHFTVAPEVTYDNIDQLVDDYHQMIDREFPGQNKGREG